MNNNKFTISNNQLIILIQKGPEIPIPDDEPVFILLARDRQALSTLRIYQSCMRPGDNCWKAMQDIIEEFTKFKDNNPDKMKQPQEAYSEV